MKKFVLFCVAITVIFLMAGCADSPTQDSPPSDLPTVEDEIPMTEAETEIIDSGEDSATQDDSPSVTPTAEEIIAGLRPLIDFASDAALLVETIEQVHPIFLMPEMLTAEHKAARDALLALDEDITRQDFEFAARRYLATLQDGHMSGFFVLFGRQASDPLILSPFLSVDWIAHDHRLFLVDENGITTDEEVLKIGGVPTVEILTMVDTYFFSENEVDRQHTHSIFSRYGTLLEKAGSEIMDRQVSLYIQSGDGKTRTHYVPINVNWRGVSALLVSSHDYIIRHEMIGDVFFIDLRTFVEGEHIDEAIASIETAIDDGVRKFIVDLRGNGGGNSMAGVRLLGAMGASTPAYGGIRRWSDLARRQRSHWFPPDYCFEEYDKFEPFPESADNPNDVFVSVLTDSRTYSSATMFGVWVQDGNLGNIIGSPSRNSPSSFGDMLNFTLPSSGITVMVSYTRWLRPDANADQTTLWPDIMVDPDLALDTAIEYLQNLNR